MKKPGKVIVLGIDGIDHRLLDILMGKGDLPHFSQLALSGSFSALETIAPPQSPVAWTTMATGQMPSCHGVYDFLTRDPGEYLPKSKILKQNKVAYQRIYPARTFWEIASDKGIPATIIKWPLTFPATPIRGCLLTGLGTPDIRGTQGTYSFYTNQELEDGNDKKGMIFPVEIKNNCIKTKVVGPIKLSLKGGKELNLPFEISLDEGNITCKLGNSIFTLEENRWSKWVFVEFKLGLLQKARGMCRFYLESIQPYFNLYMTPINIACDTKFFRTCYPLNYGEKLSQDVGFFSTLGLAEDANALDDGLITEKCFLSSCQELIAERKRILFRELDRFTEGILACVFDTTDRIQHMFWRCLDEQHPNYHPLSTLEYGSVIADTYKEMDSILGQVLQRLDDDTLLLVCSDHGFTTYRRSVHLNNWLVTNGFMALKNGKPTGAPLFSNVDWSTTSVFALGLNSLCLNVRHRERQGYLEPEAIPAFKDKLVASLKSFTDDGRTVIKNVYDPEELYGHKPENQSPDFIIGYGNGYRTSWESALGIVSEADTIEDNLRKWSGDHCCDPELVPGIFLSNRKGVATKPHLQDICTIVLDYLS